MKQKNKMTNKQILTYADNVNNAGFNHHISIMLTPSNEAHVSQRPPDVLYGERKYFVIENVESVAWEEIIKNFNKIPSPNDHMVVVKFKGHGPGQDLNFGLDGAWPILGSCFSSSLKSNVFIKPSALGAFQARLRTSVNERYRTGVNWLFEIDSCNGANHLEKVKKGYPNEHVSGVIYSSVKTVSWFGFRKRSLSIGLMGDKEEYGWNHTRTEDNANLRYITADMSHCDRPNETLSQTTQLKWYNLSGHACDWTDYAATSGYLQKYMRLYYDYLYSHFLDSHRTWLERQDHTYYSEEWLDLPGGIE